MIVPVGIALGSNLGDRSAELDAGITFLRSLAESSRVRESPRIETAPVDCTPGSPAFLNSVAEMEVDSVRMTPLNLLDYLQEFEFERGRSPLRDLNSPRPLDLDIIYYGVERIDQMGLVIPHPRAHLRPFVLEPLSHLRPELILPGQTKTVAELLTELEAQPSA
jgi:2-amino-4-hydroxy-6-hydroxymethyldihydropteridine diphosphokinase